MGEMRPAKEQTCHGVNLCCVYLQRTCYVTVGILMTNSVMNAAHRHACVLTSMEVQVFCLYCWGEASCSQECVCLDGLGRQSSFVSVETEVCGFWRNPGATSDSRHQKGDLKRAVSLHKHCALPYEIELSG